MVDHTKVNVHDLAAFGEKTFQQTHMTYLTGAAAARGNIETAVVGQVGSSEALTFQAYYEQYITPALDHFLTDSPTGIEALGTGAAVIAANYHSGDQSQATAIDAVNKVFDPGPGKSSIATEAQQSHAPKGSDRSSGHRLPPPDSSDGYSGPDAQRERWRQEGSGDELTPSEQVQEHTKLYQKDETWTPVPLPKYHPDVPYFPRPSPSNTYED